MYDDRLDKVDPEGTLVPGQRRYDRLCPREGVVIVVEQEDWDQRGRDVPPRGLSQQQ